MLFFVVVVVFFFFYFFPPNRSIAGWFYYCCIALHFFVAVKKYRGGIGEFQAPFGVAYEGVYYATKEEADEAWGSHGAKKRLELKGESPTANGVVEKNASGESSENETEKKGPGLFKLGVLCIPTKPGWSRVIIMSGGQAKETKVMANAKAKAKEASVAVIDDEAETNQALQSKAETKAKTDTDTKVETNNKKKKKSLTATIFGIIPPWAIHLLSNRFLDSDLAFLHYQEQERLRYLNTRSNGSSSISSYYFMPAAADRCIAKLRKWIPMHTDYLGGGPSHTYSLPPPIADRTKLFDRYLQHTSHCKHCQDGLKGLQKTVRRIAWGGLVASVVTSHFMRIAAVSSRSRTLGLLVKLAAIACLAALRLVSSLEQAFKVGEFKHYQND